MASRYNQCNWDNILINSLHTDLCISSSPPSTRAVPFCKRLWRRWTFVMQVLNTLEDKQECLRSRLHTKGDPSPARAAEATPLVTTFHSKIKVTSWTSHSEHPMSSFYTSCTEYPSPKRDSCLYELPTFTGTGFGPQFSIQQLLNENHIGHQKENPQSPETNLL